MSSDAQGSLDPVAYRVKFKGDPGWTLYYSNPCKHPDDMERLGLVSVQPLYASQPPAAPVETASGPITIEQLDQLQFARPLHTRPEPQRSSAETVQAKHDHRVYFMCECCHDCDPENGVSCREDIAVMPDGTWLCDNCYSDCDKSEYGMVASDVDDFEFPRFEDLPRPMPYPGQQVIPGLPQRAPEQKDKT